MTQRSIHSGSNPNVVVRVGGDVTIEGSESDHVTANTEGHWGLKVEKRGSTVEVQMGFNGDVHVPLQSNVKVYAGKNVRVGKVEGSVSIYAGSAVRVRDVGVLAHVSCGGPLDLECDKVEVDNVKFAAGGDIRCNIRLLANVRLMIHDLGGHWEGVIGTERFKIRIKAGGDVTLVTDAKIVVQPPNFRLGRIEKPKRREE